MYVKDYNINVINYWEWDSLTLTYSVVHLVRIDEHMHI